jgi:hypothetical protein
VFIAAHELFLLHTIVGQNVFVTLNASKEGLQHVGARCGGSVHTPSFSSTVVDDTAVKRPGDRERLSLAVGRDGVGEYDRVRLR